MTAVRGNAIYVYGQRYSTVERCSLDVGSTHLFSTADYERTKQDRNKPKNRDEPRESILSLVIFGFYIAIAENTAQGVYVPRNGMALNELLYCL